MKKLMLSCIAILFSASMVVAQEKTNDDKKQMKAEKKQTAAKMDLKELPQEIQDFVAKHFGDVAVKSAEREVDMLNFGNGEMYEVTLDNGVKLDFNEAGAVTEIESKKNAKIPEAALPQSIVKYVKDNYTASIVSWESDKNDQEVELSDGMDLDFDPNGKFLKED